MITAIHKMVEQARSGGNPRVIAKLASGWAVLGEKQVLRGYSLLLPDPVVPHLNAMALEVRKQFLVDMSILGEAVLNVTGATRINYEMLGNLEPALHAHVIPRYPEVESEILRIKPIWFYDWDQAPLFDLQRDKDLLHILAAELKKLNAAS
jgi:diadenosine tetraphosphate (Ap4A) HIT family hydrolase